MSILGTICTVQLQSSASVFNLVSTPCNLDRILASLQGSVVGGYSGSNKLCYGGAEQVSAVQW